MRVKKLKYGHKKRKIEAEGARKQVSLNLQPQMAREPVCCVDPDVMEHTFRRFDSVTHENERLIRTHQNNWQSFQNSAKLGFGKKKKASANCDDVFFCF